MRVAITGATGLIGTALVAALKERGDTPVALSRNAARARRALDVEAVDWDPLAGPAPFGELGSVDAVVNLAGEQIAQRWTTDVKQRLRASRVTATENLVAGLRAGDDPPSTLISGSAAGYYGDRGSDELDESAAPGDDFLASLCVDWEAAAQAASADPKLRVVIVRTGVVLDRHGGALQKLLPPFRLGLGGPVAGGGQYMPWVTLEDLVGILLAALDGAPGGSGLEWSGPVNGCAPGVVTNAEFSRALGRVLHRPAVIPVPRLGLKLLFGEMSSVLTASERMVPARTLELGYEFHQTDVEQALRSVLAD